VSAKLLNRKDKSILAWQIFNHSETAETSSTEAIISAFGEGLSQMTLKLAQWVLQPSMNDNAPP